MESSTNQDQGQEEQHSNLNEREINILVLGETGVGKSTWINAMSYYFNFESLDDVIENVRRKSKKRKPAVGAGLLHLNNEGDGDGASVWGESSTQDAYKRSFENKGNLVHFIDTPGFGDIRGVEQDKLHIEDILERLRNEALTIHGVCILLRHDSFRLRLETPLALALPFEYCIKELLTPLHRDLAPNIAFCFTNTRSVAYSPAENLRAQLEAVLAKCGLRIPLERDTMYCMDNEIIPYIAALKEGLIVSDPDTDTTHAHYSESWRVSVRETKRIVEYFSTNATINPHETKFSEPLTRVRGAIFKLNQVLAQFSQIPGAEKELDIISKIASKLAKFLKENALNLHNDVIPSYLEHLITFKEANLKEREDLDGDLGEIQELQNLRQVYVDEEKGLMDVINKLDLGHEIVDSDDVSLDDLAEIFDALQSPQENLLLILTGDAVKTAFASVEKESDEEGDEN